MDAFYEHTSGRLAKSGYGTSVDEASSDTLIERSGLAARAASLLLVARLAAVGGDVDEQRIAGILARLGPLGTSLAANDSEGTAFLRRCFAGMERPVYDVLLMTGLMLSRLAVAFAEAKGLAYDDRVLTVIAASSAGHALDAPPYGVRGAEDVAAFLAGLDGTGFVVQVFRGAERLGDEMSSGSAAPPGDDVG